jgi:hypothetical protein
MKKQLLILALLLPLTSLAQKIYIKDGKLNGILPVDDKGLVTYQAVRTVEGAQKDELFKRARKWFLKNLHSPEGGFADCRCKHRRTFW